MMGRVFRFYYYSRIHSTCMLGERVQFFNVPSGSPLTVAANTLAAGNV